MQTSQSCASDKLRRETLRNHLNEAGKRDFNGIDYLEVSDDQLTLSLFFMGKAPRHLSTANVRIDGGRRVRQIKVVHIQVCHLEDQELEDCMQVLVDQPGDFSTYTLKLVEPDTNGEPSNTPLAGFDPRYAEIEFNFKVNCSSDLDCVTGTTCPPPEFPEPELNYLAKDFASFRQLIFDRLALTVPDWQERHIPDIGVTIAEVLAYVGDYLSYYQDAVATEAYLSTARQRISVRRHARLIDYRMHEGCNARTWLHLDTDSDITINPANFFFITGYNQLPTDKQLLNIDEFKKLPAHSFEVFEPMTSQPLALHAAHNEIHFYTWGEKNCCLPRGATSATLLDSWVDEAATTLALLASGHHERHQDKRSEATTTQTDAKEPAPRQRHLKLQPGDLLLFEEYISPKTGNQADANPTKRHIVRLTKVEPIIDALYNQPIVEISWAAPDALPFALCLSAFAPSPLCQELSNISFARGNLLLVDHGQSVTDWFEPVAAAQILPDCEPECCGGEVSPQAAPFTPTLSQARLLYSQLLPADANNLPASQLAGKYDPRQAVPQIKLLAGLGALNNIPVNTTALTRIGETVLPPEEWTARPDLLDSQALHNHFVVEIDNDGLAHLRFGDGELGRRPHAGTKFQARYRIGNNLAGNVGAEAISRIVFYNFLEGVDIRPRNPLAAEGGTAPETLAEVKMFAPSTFRSELGRAITADDYVRLAERNPAVQRAAAQLHWTGSWYEALVAIDPLGREGASSHLLGAIERELWPYCRIGHDLKVISAEYVPLDITMQICVLPHYLQGHVLAALRDLFSNRVLGGGKRGFFHPDNLSFGDNIYLSQLVALAQAVEGVESVVITKLQRLYHQPNYELENGVLKLNSFEIARLDNDPNRPEYGQLKFVMKGGR